MTMATESGESSKVSTADAEYPCVRRLRHRRLLNFLWLQGHESAHELMAADTAACFSVVHLRRFVERGQWFYAAEYLLRFLPPGLDRLGLEAQVLRRFLATHMAIANILDGTKDGEMLAASYAKYRSHGSSVRQGAIRLRSIILTALHGKQQFRASFDWERVRSMASEIVDDLAYRTPELKHVVLKPGGPMKPHNVLPIGFSYRRRCPRKKQSRWPRASSVAKGYIRKRSSLLSSSCSQEPRDAMLNKAMNMVADAVDKSLKAGIRPKLNQEHPLQPKGPAQNPGIPSVLNASKLASCVPMLSGPFSGSMFIAPVSPTVFGILPSHHKNFGSSLATNAGGAPIAPVSQSMNLTSHAEMSGATVAPIAQTRFGTFPGTANITGIPSMTNADKLTRHVLSSGVPFSRMMFGAPASQTMSPSLITPAENSRVSLISNAGATVAPVTHNTMAGPARDLRMPSVANAGATVDPVTQAMFGTNTMAGPARDPRMTSVANAGATVAPVTQAMFGTMAGRASDARMPSVENAGELSSHVQSAGLPVSQAVFECLSNRAKNTLISMMKDAGGAPIAPVSQSMNLTSHAEMSGATVAPIAQTRFGTFPGTANITGIPSMTNAGATVAPVTQAMFGTNTMAGPARDLRMPSVANAGATVDPLTQAMFGTNTMAGPARDPRMTSVANAGATVAPVTQAMFGTMAGPASDPRMPSVENAGELSSHVQSAGLPVSQAVFECLSNRAKNTLISMMKDAESSHQSISARKNTREELNPDEQDLHPKWQWTTGAFNEADLAAYLEGPSEIETEARDICT